MVVPAASLCGVSFSRGDLDSTSVATDEADSPVVTGIGSGPKISSALTEVSSDEVRSASSDWSSLG